MDADNADILEKTTNHTKYTNKNSFVWFVYFVVALFKLRYQRPKSFHSGDPSWLAYL